MQKPKGFTLVEILLILVVIAMLGVVAISSFLDTTDTFNFLSSEKAFVTSVKTAKAFAVSNKDRDEYDRFGVFIDKNEVVLFGDRDPSFIFDPNDEVFNQYSFCFNPDGCTTITTAISGDQYDVTHLTGSLPMRLYFQNGTGELMAFDNNNNPLSKNDYKVFSFSFSDPTEPSYLKYLNIIYVSALIEESDEQL